MLIKSFKSAIDYLEGKPHEPDVLTRREFMEGSAKVGGVLLSVPVWASIFRADKALADAIDDAAQVSPWSFSVAELSGGMGFSNVFGVTLAGGALYEGVNTRALGIRANQTWRKDLIKGLALNSNDSYIDTLLAGGAANLPIQGQNNYVRNAIMTPEMVTTLLSKTAGFRIACPKDDDTSENRINPLDWIQMVRVGSLVKTVGANGGLRSRRVTGARALPIVSGGNVTGLVNAVRLQNNLLNTNALGSQIAQASNGLSQAQASRHQGRVGLSDLMRNLASGLSEAAGKFDPTLGSRAFDPMDASNTAAVSAVINFNALTDREKVIFASYLANARGIAGSCYVENGGYDYHNGRRDVPEVMHSEVARNDLIWMAAQHIANKPGFLYKCTDGGIGWSNEDTPLALGDRGSAGMGVCMIFQPGGVSGLAVRDVGHYTPTTSNGGEACDRNVFVAKDPRHEGICAMVNWAKLSGNAIDPSVIRSLVSDIVRSDAEYNSLFAV